jgi:hypothetical protein
MALRSAAAERPSIKERNIMNKQATIPTASTIVTLSLAGCIAVSDNSGPGSKVSENTELAIRVCGGEGNVAEVTREGYKCKGLAQ